MRGRMNDAQVLRAALRARQGDVRRRGRRGRGGRRGRLAGRAPARLARARARRRRPGAPRSTVPDGVSPSALLGALGMPGMTAWVGLTEIAPVRGGRDRVHLRRGGRGRQRRGPDRQGARLPRDRQRRRAGEGRLRARRARLRRRVLDYRDDVRAALREAAPDGVDVYFDNVGGPQLEAAIGALQPRRADRALRRGVAVQRDRAAARPAQPRRCWSASACACAASSSATTPTRERRSSATRSAG